MKSGLTTRDQVVDQRLFAFEQILFENLVPVVPIEDELVLEEV